jgi:hypothetical protein
MPIMMASNASASEAGRMKDGEPRGRTRSRGSIRFWPLHDWWLGPAVHQAKHRELRLMPDRAENDFAIVRCRARVVPLRTVNERLSDASASAAQEYERRRVRVAPAHYPLVTQRGRSSAKKYQARTPDSKSGEGKSRERKRSKRLKRQQPERKEKHCERQS